MLNKYHYLVKKHRKAIREGVENMIQHINKSLIAGTEMQKTINQNKENNSW